MIWTIKNEVLLLANDLGDGCFKTAYIYADCILTNYQLYQLQYYWLYDWQAKGIKWDQPILTLSKNNQRTYYTDDAIQAQTR